MTTTNHRHHRLARGVQAYGAPFLACFVAGVMAFLSIEPVNAQQARQQALQCATHDKMVERLSSRFTEVPVSLGLAANGNVLEVFTTRDGDTWTIVATAPEGKSCIMAAGKYWQTIPFEPDGPEA